MKKIIILAVLLLSLVFSSGCSILKGLTYGINNSSEAKLLSRSANNSDVLLNGETDLSNLGAKYIVTPQHDIDGLKLKIKVCDSKGNALKTYDKYLGNVARGVSVTFSISIADLGLVNSLKASYMRCSVVGGTVSYFA